MKAIPQCTVNVFIQLADYANVQSACIMQMCSQNVRIKSRISSSTSAVPLPIVAAAPGGLWVLSKCLLICVSHCLVLEHNDINITINITTVTNENSTLKNECYWNISVQRSTLNDLSKVGQVPNSAADIGQSTLFCPIMVWKVSFCLWGPAISVKFDKTFLPLSLVLKFAQFDKGMKCYHLLTTAMDAWYSQPSASGLTSVKESLQN